MLVTHEADVAAAVVEAVFWECWRGGAPTDGHSVSHSLTLAARRAAERLQTAPTANQNGRSGD